jgi:hypothetical protein
MMIEEEEDVIIHPFVPPTPPPKCKQWAHPEWRGNATEGFWICVDDREWEATIFEDA